MTENYREGQQHQQLSQVSQEKDVLQLKPKAKAEE